MRRVLIVYKYIPQYRREFFDQLRAKLASTDIELVLVYGDPTATEALKNDAVQPAWGKYVRNRVVPAGAQSNIIFQPVLRIALQCDLVIVEQANRLLVNPVLLLFSKSGLCKLAFWGHGMNLQKQESFFTRRLKILMARRVHWWFAYNVMSAKIVHSLGFPDDRITRVMNTIDSRGLVQHLASISEEELIIARRRLGIDGSCTCLYIGGMYDLKRLDFLLTACSMIYAQMPSFRMLFVGSGIEADKIASFAEEHRWCRFVGAQFGRDKALYLKLAQLLLMPGLVGLAVVDSFAACVPIVTTNVTFHSPEIEYLQSGENGLVVSPCDDAALYAAKVVELLQSDGTILQHLRAGCSKAADTYSMERMVERFAQGVCEALQ